MKVTATLSNVHVAPRKARLVAGLIRGLGVAEAKIQLEKSVKKMSLPLVKLLESARANAENNFSLDRETLRVVRVDVNEGQKLKRFMPRAQGRATPIWRRLSHVTIVIEGLAAEKAVKKTLKKATTKKTAEIKPATKKTNTSKTASTKKTVKTVEETSDTHTSEQSA
jgi:large subunit ribosomal protein L22